MTVVPAIIAKTQLELDGMLKPLTGISRVQLDVMDGKFVPNESLTFDLTLPPNMFYEAHLMIEDPDAWISSHGKKVDLILPHFEAVQDLKATLQSIRDLGKKTGLVINPKTQVDVIIPYLSHVDMVLVMTVEPGFYGSKFLPATLNKVKELRRANKKIDIEVDGGIVPGTAKLAKKAGATVFVSGSYIMKSKDPLASFKKLERDVK